MAARAVYDFESGGVGELTFHTDDVLTIIRQDIGDGWWEAVDRTGRKGLVPEAYLELMSYPEPNMPPPPPPPTMGTQQQSPWSEPPQNSWNGSTTHHQQQPKPPSAAVTSWNNAPPPAAAVHANGPPAIPPQPKLPVTTNKQESYDDWDDDWDDDDSSTTTDPPSTLKTSKTFDSLSTTSDKELSGQRDRPSDKFGTVRSKTFSRFSSFAKSGGEAYLFTNQHQNVSDADLIATILIGKDGPYWGPTQHDFSCEIKSPKKESKFHGMKSFIAYAVTPSFSNIQVSRRYKHFDWLHSRLTEKFTVCCVPPLPDKQVSGRYEDDFINERMRQLQLWVDRMCRHPVVSRAEVFQHFLTCTDDKKWKLGKRRSEKDDFLGGKMFLTVKAPEQQLDGKDTDATMERFTRFIKNLDDSVKHAFHVGESNVKKHQGPFKKEYQKLGETFIAVAKSFEFDERPEAQGLTNAMHETGNAYRDIGSLFEQQPKHDMQDLLEGLLEYKGMLSVFPDVLSVHRAATSKIQENAARLSDSEISKVQERADVISYATLAEMNLFQQNRVGDFKGLMTNYLRGQIEFYKKITSKLETSLKQYDNS